MPNTDLRAHFRESLLRDGGDAGQARGCVIIAEVAQAHDGSLGMAHAYIDAIARTGADAVKFQTHIAAAESTLVEPWRIKFSLQDATRRDYWKRMEFTEEQWQGLKSHASEAGLLFISSPFSVEAARLLKRVGVSAWKVASGELASHPMLQEIAVTQLPVLISTGMSPLYEIDNVVRWLKDNDLPFAVMQCTSLYPCPPEKVGVNLLSSFRGRYGCAVGLSDHSGTIYPCLAATVLGADVLEVHAVFSREMFGPDVPASVTVSELRQLVEGIRVIERMISNPVDKDLLAEQMGPMRDAFTKSIVAAVNLSAGTRLQAEHLAMKKPGTGISPWRASEVLGRVLKYDIECDQVIRLDCLE
jgi:N,N'-diacetyllegionaminate synthase